MILQSLYQLYGRLSSDSQYDISPPGYSLQKIAFCLVLKPDGTLNAIQSLVDRESKRPRQMIMPGGAKSTGGVTEKSVMKKVRFLRNDLPFLIGLGVNKTKSGLKTEKQELIVRKMEFKAFKQYHLKLKEIISDEEYQAVCRFLENWNPEEGIQHPEWAEFCGGQGVFKIIGKRHYVHDRPEAKSWWETHSSKRTDKAGLISQCLITGKDQPIARLHTPKIKRVAGSQSSGALLVSFDKASDSFSSYGRDGEQGYNAPVSTDAAFRYTTALNALLDGPMSNKHRFSLGEATVVFWTEKPTNTEDIFAIFTEGKLDLSNQEKAQDESIRQKIQLFLKALRRGKEVYAELDREADRTNFYLLGLTGQAKGRIGVRFFYRDTLSTLLDNLRRHFKDLAIVRWSGFGEYRWRTPEFPELWDMLAQTVPAKSRREERDKQSAILIGPILKAVIMGTPYPTGLFYSVMRRIHADRQVNYIRACIIAGYLRRNLKKEVSMCLDHARKEPSYRLGRLFAVLEKVQGEALGKINAGIRDRFYSSASATPGIVFPRILRTYQHHLAKLPEGLRINRERLVQEILAPVSDFPSNLDLAGQGLFALGYYHQAKELWTAKVKKGKQEGGEE